MDALEVLYTRRSIRAFTSEPVDEETVKALLSAAMIAPTAGNSQGWRFIVITDRARLDAIAEVHPFAKMAKDAPLAILVCGDTENVPERYKAYWAIDGAAAIQNILLAGRALNIGTVWCGVHPVPEREAAMRELFALPAHINPVGLVIAGHPAQPFKREDRYDSEKVHHNTW